MVWGLWPKLQASGAQFKSCELRELWASGSGCRQSVGDFISGNDWGVVILGRKTTSTGDSALYTVQVLLCWVQRMISTILGVPYYIYSRMGPETLY